MASNPPEILRDRGRSLEEQFFAREDQRVMEKLKQLKAAEASRDALAKASGITQPEILDKLMALGIGAETVAALALVPLVEVAWADGTLDAKERRAVIERASVPSGSPEATMLEAWLDRRPDPKLLTAWTHLVQGMTAQLDAPGRERLKTGLLERARAVAGASGGVLGVGAKVSRPEGEMLAKLEAAFDAKR